MLSLYIEIQHILVSVVAACSCQVIQTLTNYSVYLCKLCKQVMGPDSLEY